MQRETQERVTWLTHATYTLNFTDTKAREFVHLFPYLTSRFVDKFELHRLAGRSLFVMCE